VRNLSKVFMAGFLTLFISQSYAITVNVQTSSSGVHALGFTVNGSKHGGLGSSYQGGDMPAGRYKFGVRAHERDIPCPVNGKRSVTLSSDANVQLTLNGNKCVGQVN
jgi:hypothetical protein